MATMIANDCINCGACEPECPNNAISQGDPIFVIDPVLCTECVGFHDYEACAAVCPVDVCITDPNNIESEEALIAQGTPASSRNQFWRQFRVAFSQRPRESGRAPAGAAAQTPGIAGRPEAQRPRQSRAGAVSAFVEADVNYVELPPIDSWNIPMRCYKCNRCMRKTSRIS